AALHAARRPDAEAPGLSLAAWPAGKAPAAGRAFQSASASSRSTGVASRSAASASRSAATSSGRMLPMWHGTRIDAVAGPSGVIESKRALIIPVRLETWMARATGRSGQRSEEHTSELQSRENLVCRLLLEKKKKTSNVIHGE